MRGREVDEGRERAGEGEGEGEGQVQGERRCGAPSAAAEAKALAEASRRPPLAELDSADPAPGSRPVSRRLKVRPARTAVEAAGAFLELAVAAEAASSRRFEPGCYRMAKEVPEVSLPTSVCSSDSFTFGHSAAAAPGLPCLLLLFHRTFRVLMTVAGSASRGGSFVLGNPSKVALVVLLGEWSCAKRSCAATLAERPQAQNNDGSFIDSSKLRAVPARFE